jgi:hypothetical protein
MSMIKNLRYVQTNGIKKFLKNEQEKWKCPACGVIICVHNKTCYDCRQIQKKSCTSRSNQNYDKWKLRKSYS